MSVEGSRRNGSTKSVEAVESQVRSKSIVKSELRRFLPTIRAAYKTTADTSLPRVWLRYIGFCESINLACVTTMLILMQRACNACFNASAQNREIFDSFVDSARCKECFAFICFSHRIQVLIMEIVILPSSCFFLSNLSIALNKIFLSIFWNVSKRIALVVYKLLTVGRNATR